jgi:signal peptidase II
LKNKTLVAVLLTLLVLVADQSLKVWIKTHFVQGDGINLIGNWARLSFVENPGMAFGFTFGGNLGKLFLSLFRIVAIGFLLYYITRLIKNNASTGLVLCFSAIFAGAVGNMIDCAFYGLIFSESDVHGMHVAKLFPPEGGYASFLHGRVVDMLYFPLGHFPQWLPFIGGAEFFQPVFNIADAAITTGVIAILVFHRNYFNLPEEPKAVSPLVINETEVGVGDGDENMINN